MWHDGRVHDLRFMKGVHVKCLREPTNLQTRQSALCCSWLASPLPPGNFSVGTSSQWDPESGRFWTMPQTNFQTWGHVFVDDSWNANLEQFTKH